VSIDTPTLAPARELCCFLRRTYTTPRTTPTTERATTTTKAERLVPRIMARELAELGSGPLPPNEETDDLELICVVKNGRSYVQEKNIGQVFVNYRKITCIHYNVVYVYMYYICYLSLLFYNK